MQIPIKSKSCGLGKITSCPFLKTAGGIEMWVVAVAAVSGDVLPYISDSERVVRQLGCKKV